MMFGSPLSTFGEGGAKGASPGGQGPFGPADETSPLVAGVELERHDGGAGMSPPPLNIFAKQTLHHRQRMDHQTPADQTRRIDHTVGKAN